jgi:hypothetical protein
MKGAISTSRRCVVYGWEGVSEEANKQGNTGKTEVEKRNLETGLGEERHDEAAEAAVDVQTDAVLDGELRERLDVCGGNRWVWKGWERARKHDGPSMAPSGKFGCMGGESASTERNIREEENRRRTAEPTSAAVFVDDGRREGGVEELEAHRDDGGVHLTDSARVRGGGYLAHR